MCDPWACCKWRDCCVTIIMKRIIIARCHHPIAVSRRTLRETPMSLPSETTGACAYYILH